MTFDRIIYWQSNLQIPSQSFQHIIPDPPVLFCGNLYFNFYCSRAPRWVKRPNHSRNLSFRNHRWVKMAIYSRNLSFTVPRWVKSPICSRDSVFRRRLLDFSGVPNVAVFCLNSKIPDIFHPASITPGSTCLHLVSFPLTPAADLGTHSRAVGGTSLEADSLPPIILSCNPQYWFPDISQDQFLL